MSQIQEANSTNTTTVTLATARPHVTPIGELPDVNECVSGLHNCHVSPSISPTQATIHSNPLAECEWPFSVHAALSGRVLTTPPFPAEKRA